jgi:uncharacterized damage-inducible protein DinB
MTGNRCDLVFGSRIACTEESMSLPRRAFLADVVPAALALPLLESTRIQAPDLFEALKSSSLHAWKRSSAYLLRVADAMPVEEYDFRPTSEVRSFAEQVLHLAMTVYGFAAIVRGEAPPPASRFDRNEKGKGEMLGQLDEACKYATAAISSLTPTRALEMVAWGGIGYEDIAELPVLAVVDVLSLHTAHHRAQMTLHLRLRGLVPPPYVD